MSETEFAGKLVFVTGGSKGVGEAIVRRFAAGGAMVGTAARSQQPEGNPAKLFVRADLSTRVGTDKVGRDVLDKFGRVDVLIHNAGGSAAPGGGALVLSDADWQGAFDMNPFAAVRLDRGFLPLMLKQGAGVIIHISSIQCSLPLFDSTLAYAAAKAALTNYSKGLSKEVAFKGIRVNSVAPGYTETEAAVGMVNEIAQRTGINAEAARQRIMDSFGGIPMGRPTIIPNMAARDVSRSEQSLDIRLVVDTIPTLAWSSHPDGAVDFVNQRWREYSGLSAEESYGAGWKAAIHPDDIPELTAKWEASHDGSDARLCELRLRRSDGVFRWFSLRREPQCDETGELLRWYGTAVDIEDRKRSETILAAENRTLQMIANGGNLSDVLNDLCAAIDVHASATSFVCLMDRNGKELFPVAGPRVPSAFAGAMKPWPIGPNRGSCGTAAFTKERVVIRDISDDSRWPDDARAFAINHGVRAAWSEPLITQGGEVLGTFCISYGQPRTPHREDLELIEAAGHIARIAIERQRSQETLREALGEIQKSEARLRRVIDTIPTLAWCNLPDGPNEFLNKRWHDYTGLSHEESHGWGWKTAFHPADLPALMERWQQLLITGEPGEIEARLRRHDGVFRWFLIRVEPFRDETGKLIRWYGTSTDIDALKKTEEKLREDERELRRITDAIPQTIVVLGPSGAPLYANQATLDYTGLTAEDVVAPLFRERIFHLDDLERLRDERKASFERGLPFEAEMRTLGKDGHYRWFLIRYNPFRNEQGQLTRWYATGTDIHERVRLEERTRNENIALREQIDRDSMFEDIVGSSDVLRKVLRQVTKVAPADSTVLLLGETGTGKELIARAIHKRSNRAERAFMAVNCAAIPSSLIASELFGHEKGAFTGATQRRLGRFESANGGTIFLDEVGDLPAEIQISLLRVLQEREIERVGGNRTIPVDVRVVAATHRDLKALVAAGKFRADLLYRLNVVPIEMPSLRDRVDDIPLLVEYFIDRFGKRQGKKFRRIDKKTMKAFQSYQWPGNVRELQNVIERAVILSEDDTFSVDETWLTAQTAGVTKPTVALGGALLRHEREMIETALAQSHGRVSGPAGAAAKLGLPSRTLDSKIKRLKINKSRFKDLS